MCIILFHALLLNKSLDLFDRACTVSAVNHRACKVHLLVDPDTVGNILDLAYSRKVHKMLDLAYIHTSSDLVACQYLMEFDRRQRIRSEAFSMPMDYFLTDSKMISWGHKTRPYWRSWQGWYRPRWSSWITRSISSKLIIPHQTYQTNQWLAKQPPKSIVGILLQLQLFSIEWEQ